MIELKEEQKALLEMIAEELGGKLEYHFCSTLHTKYKKIVITYDAQQK